MTLENLNKQLIITSFLLLAVILLFEFTNLDVNIQSYFYNFEEKKWLIHQNPTLKYIFYDGFKKLFFIVLFILIVILSFAKRFNISQRVKKSLLILLLSMMFVPSLALIKNLTNMPCPYHLDKFGGTYPEIKLFEPYPKDFVQEKKVRCYPAGHATMGFSFMALYFLFKTRRNKNLALGFGIILGSLTGTYKILIGDHFLSHTLVTMIGAWLVILFIYKLSNKA